jgi:hypothetical protein
VVVAALRECAQQAGWTALSMTNDTFTVNMTGIKQEHGWMASLFISAGPDVHKQQALQIELDANPG